MATSASPDDKEMKVNDEKQPHKPGKKVRIDKLGLSRETVGELTESEAEQVVGGAAAAPGKLQCCTNTETGCVTQPCARLV